VTIRKAASGSQFDEVALSLLMELLSIPGASGEEDAVSNHIVARLLEAGLPQDAVTVDHANRKGLPEGRTGNLIVKLPGTRKAPRRLLMAHLDTVPLCVGAEPVISDDQVVSQNRRTALGGDNRAGCAVVLNTAIRILQDKLPHPPLTLLWTVQEEVGLLGARHLSTSKLGQPKLCFNWDGGAPNAIVLGATGGVHLDIEIYGQASHAGAHPEDGVSALAIAGLAISELQRNGWHGRVVKGKQRGTSNMGFVHGGGATNVVMDEVVLRAEARSHNPRFRQRIVEAYEAAFHKAASSITNVAGKPGRVEVTVIPKYEAFRLPTTDPSCRKAKAVIEAEGLPVITRVVDGGLDANWMTAHGFPTVTLGCGQSGIHTVEETLLIPDFLQACRIAQRLAVEIE
jgi:tripeptide aminopeptidase